MKILFQGDSITDNGRKRKVLNDLGNGYPLLVAQMLTERYPNIKFEFINKGIGGDQTKDLLLRWQNDCIDLRPDIVTLLVGVNDTWHHCGDGQWVANELYEANYRYLLESIKNNTNAKIVVMEQFVLDFPEMESFHNDIDEKIRITRKLAREYADAFIALDGIFASACIAEPPSYWTREGVHPTERGHELIATHCCKAVSYIIEKDGVF